MGPRMQVFNFWDASSGALYIAVPPDSIQVATLLSRAISEALGSPLTLPLEPLLGVSPEGLASVCQGLGLGSFAVAGELVFLLCLKSVFYLLAYARCAQNSTVRSVQFTHFFESVIAILFGTHLGSILVIT